MDDLNQPDYTEIQAQRQSELLDDLKNRLAHERPAPWDSLPDLPLYMDQVVAYLSRQLITFGENERLTSAMINNYIKDGIVPRAKGKRYDREHLAILTTVAALKQVLSVRDMGTLLENNVMRGSVEESYENFRSILDTALNDTLNNISHLPDDCNLSKVAVTLAIRSYADALVCRRILDLLCSDSEDDSSPKKKKKKS